MSTLSTRKTFFAKLIGLLAVSVGGTRLVAREASPAGDAAGPAKSTFALRPEQRAVSRRDSRA